ncbi:MAG: isochorismatase family protein [Puniceicoccales bacterium]|jgi:nicotinamidase-related amidase/type 1 glutamine amidotransferase|nr:isochorismatase family protein [Puniceicoccales bacterium]
MLHLHKLIKSALLTAALFAVFATATPPVAAQDTAAALRVSKQDRLPFKTQLEEEVAKLKAHAAKLEATDSANAKKEAAISKKEAARLEGDIAKLSATGISVRNTIEDWNPAETAIIICDMWNKHWCKHATARVAELAPAMNEVLTAARAKGVTIVHAPSETLAFYKDHPARKTAEKYAKPGVNAWAGKLPSEKGKKDVVDPTRNGGCPECKGGQPYPWTRQIEALTIEDKDLISDNGTEIKGYFKDKGIKNVILMGVHTNMCVIGRPFGLRAMRHAGFNTVLMRDMTDLMYNSVIGREKGPGAGFPFVNHFSGLDLQVEYIETYVAPSIVSTDFTGKKQFRFKEDTRPRVAILTAESEYRASQRLAEFSHDLTLRNIHSDFALGVPIMNGPGRHNLENLQILDDANLALVFIRRRALEADKLGKIKAYVASGRPVLGIRTASHAFDAKGNVPRSGGAIEASKENAAGNLAQWADFDKDVLGGNYQGHYGHLKTGTDVTIADGQADHPLLKGVAAKFTSPCWLYRNTPLRTPNATVLLYGHNPGKAPEPIFWINNAGKGTVVYTSLGHWDDWKIESFRNLMFNTVDFLLGKKPAEAPADK